jgi:hypothetical protein
MEQVTRGRWRKWIVVCLTVGLGLCRPCACEGADEVSQYQVQAAFLLNFTKFVEWPASAFAAQDSPIAICILGADPFGSALDQMVAEEEVNGRKVAARRVKQAPPPKSCQVLYAGGSEKDVSKILSALGPGTLTVGEGEAFVRDGGMIAFVIEKRRVRFEIDRAAAEKAGLKLSSRLLNVAKSVE